MKITSLCLLVVASGTLVAQQIGNVEMYGPATVSRSYLRPSPVVDTSDFESEVGFDDEFDFDAQLESLEDIAISSGELADYSLLLYARSVAPRFTQFVLSIGSKAFVVYQDAKDSLRSWFARRNVNIKHVLIGLKLRSARSSESSDKVADGSA